MKRRISFSIILLFVLSTKVFSQSSVNIIKSTNIDVVLKSNQALFDGNIDAYQSTYSPEATIQDNLKINTLNENLEVFKFMLRSGIKVSKDGKPTIWESINDISDESGIHNWVICYSNLIFQKGTQKVKILLNQVCGMKDGKILKEMDIYDSSELTALFK